jgi:hypothetical protein
MLDGDTRSDAQADADWRQTTRALFGGQAALTAHNLTPQDSLNGESPRDLVFNVRDQMPRLDISPRNVTTESIIAFRKTALDHDLVSCPFDPVSAYSMASVPPFPHTDMSPINSKQFRRILAARESIF